MKYLKLFENFKDSDIIKDTIEEIFYEFSDLRVNVTKRLNTNDNYRVVVENKIESTLDNDESDLYRHWNYFENKGELNERFIQLFKYMYDEGYSPKVSYSKIIGDGGFVDSPYYINGVKQFDVIHMGINTPRELYNNFAEDERLVKVEIIFYKDGRVVNESAEYKYGCVMIETPFDNWSEITSIIDEQDLYNEPGDNTYGIQNNPHVTLLYGLHKEVTPKMVESALEGFNGSKININGVGVFENENFDVVKLNVDPTGSLQVMHDKLCEFPHTSDYPVYEPHITIGYVKKGLGKKYLNSNYRYNRLVDRVCYSMTNGEKIYFNL